MSFIYFPKPSQGFVGGVVAEASVAGEAIAAVEDGAVIEVDGAAIAVDTMVATAVSAALAFSRI